ncbi:MAG TPA: WD40 repeat domain-containing protein [Anaerolineales bacterium]|nr:WD40 repeat domain-containing protein [Anaerolineales bacterium]
MRKTFSLALVAGLFISACGGTGTPLPIATVIPSPTHELAEAVPTLLTEIDLETQTGTSYSLAWSPDGETLAVASGGEITLLSRDIKATRAVLKPEGGALGVTWRPDGQQFATVNGFRNQTIRLWDWDSASNELRRAQEIQAGVDQYGVSWSPDGTTLASLAGDSKSIIQTWDTNTWEEISKYDLPYTHPRRTLNWNADNSTVYGAGESSGEVVVFGLHVTDGSVDEMAKFSIADIEVFAISPGAEKLAVAGAHLAQIMDTASGAILMAFKSVDQPVDLAWNPDGMTVAILDYKTKLQLWDVSD